MQPSEFWLNFNLGKELAISGAFIYNGLRQFHEMQNLDFAEDLFEFLYNLSVGLERLLKVAVVLLEYDQSLDQDAFERSLITHNHLDLLARIRKHRKLPLKEPHNELLAILSKFYKSVRYDRFNLSSVSDLEKEREAISKFLNMYLNAEISDGGSIFGTPNKDRYRKFIRKITIKISNSIYEAVRERASSLNLYTYELRNASKAETVFLGNADIPSEDVLWKELLLFFMNTKDNSGYLEFLRSIPPLDFDPALVGDYLDCFQSDAAKARVIGELQNHYEEMEDRAERIEMINLIGAQGVDFELPDEEVEDVRSQE